jgi:hypothetical protein
MEEKDNERFIGCNSTTFRRGDGQPFFNRG